MKLKIPVILIFLLEASRLLSQPVILNTKHYGGSKDDVVQSVTPDNMGHIYVSGFSFSANHDISTNAGSKDGWLMKLDTMGNLLWSKTYGGDKADEFYSVMLLNNTTLVAVGSTESDTPYVGTNHGTSDLWLVCMDTAGSVKWNKCYGGPNWENGRFALKGYQSDIYLFGTTTGSGGQVTSSFGQTDWWVFAADSSGNLILDFTYGGSSAEYLNTVTRGFNGEIYIGGSTYSNNGTVQGNSGGQDGWVINLDTVLNFRYQKCFGLTGSDGVYSIISEPKRTLVTGTCNSVTQPEGHGGNDATVWVLDSTNVLAKTHYYGGNGSDEIKQILSTSDSTYAILAKTTSSAGQVGTSYGSKDCWLFHIDTAFNFISGIPFGTNAVDEASGILPLANNRFLFVATADSSNGNIITNYGQRDCWTGIIDSSLHQSIRVNNIIYNKLKAFPVPATGKLTISFQASEQSRIISINDITGRMISRIEIPPFSTSTSVDISGFNSGFYLIQDDVFKSVNKIIIR